MKRLRRVILVGMGILVLVPVTVGAQDSESSRVEAFYRGVAEHFGVSSREVLILSEWSLPPDHVPVLLFLSRRGGVSPDALAALKRTGRSWLELARRYGLDAGHLHLPLPPGSEGPLEAAYERYRSVPPARWAEVSLDDAEVAALVNARVLSELLGVDPARILAEASRGGSFVAAYHRLLGG